LLSTNAAGGVNPPRGDKESLRRGRRRSTHADPLVCRQCGGKLKIIAYVSDEISVKRILAVLGLSPPEDEKPPPVREVVFLPVDDEGREIQVG
jgi:hypothetical protein